MTLLAVAPFRRTAVAATALLSLLAARAGGQVTTLTHTEDASPIPTGVLRIRLTTGWTRFDRRYGAGGLTSLGDELSADPLGASQFPRLAPIESAIQSLAADPRLRLSLGRLVTRGDARIVSTPIALEYGLTRRLSVGVVIPVVQARRVIGLDVNSSTGTPANVGFVRAALRDAAGKANAAAATSSADAATLLAARISGCAATPATSGCAAINADPAGAAAARARAIQLAAAATALGTTEATALIAPRQGGNFAVEIELQRVALNEQLQRFLQQGDLVKPVYFATTNFSYIDLQGRDGTPGLLQSTIGGGLDSIRTTDRVGFGDISIGAQYLVFDRFQHDTLPMRRGWQSRLAIGGAIRLATSRADTATSLVDIGTGEGAAVEGRAAYDLIRGRLGGTIAARYVKSFARDVSAPLYGDPEAAIPLPVFGRRERTYGDVVGLDLTPRYLLNESFALDAHYGLERTGATTWSSVALNQPDAAAICAIADCTAPAGSARTAQRVGVGLRYSTVDAWLRGAARLPIEASYTHLTTVSGDPGVEKVSREQIQLRVYYRLFGR